MKVALLIFLILLILWLLCDYCFLSAPPLFYPARAPRAGLLLADNAPPSGVGAGHFLGSPYHYIFKNITHFRHICNFGRGCICVFVFVYLCICMSNTWEHCPWSIDHGHIENHPIDNVQKTCQIQKKSELLPWEILFGRFEQKAAWGTANLWKQ